MICVISLGAGVQSTTLALMAARGEIGPMPDCAIFADTQWEPAAVYKHLDWLEQQLPFPVHRVTKANIREHIARPRGKYTRVDIPAYVMNADGSRGGLMQRGCTREFKIRPIVKKVRELIGLTGKRAPKVPVVEQWIGISTDEAMRMKPSHEDFIAHRWPLIEMRMSRGDCLEWIKRNGFPQPPKSACIGCPFHDNEQWRALTPAEFAEAVEVDKRLRGSVNFRAKGTLFLHRSMVPLDQVDLRSDEEKGQLNMFNNECEGMCGV